MLHACAPRIPVSLLPRARTATSLVNKRCITSYNTATDVKAAPGTKAKQREVAESIARRLHIEQWHDWYRITVRDVQTAGGAELLWFFNNSLSRMLKTLYPHHPWATARFVSAQGAKSGNNSGSNSDNNSNEISDNSQTELENRDDDRSKRKWSVASQREELTRLETDLGITNPEEWYQMSRELVELHNGRKLLCQYDNNMCDMLRALRPSHRWKEWMFLHVPKRFWESLSNQQRMLDWMGAQLGLRTWEDWYQVTSEQIYELGASGILSFYYNGSPAQMLKAVYPQYPWVPWRFTKIPKGFWEDKNHVRWYFDWLIERHKLSGPEELADKSFAFFIQNYGKTLLVRYPQQQALKIAYPDLQDKVGPSAASSSSSGEHRLLRALQKIFPSLTPREKYRHPDLTHEQSGQPMELDFFYPELKLAFEYQGEHHYQSIYRGAVKKQYERDTEKKQACKLHNITLVPVPFWWDGTVGSLAATLLKFRPELPLPQTVLKRARNSRMIEEGMPHFQRQREAADSQPHSVFLKIAQYKEHVDPTNTVLSGYSGGLRVIWHNGLFHLQPQQPLPQQQQQQRLTTRVILTPPEWFRRQIPWDLCLDGHLIACDNSNNNSNSKNNDSNSTSTKAQALLQIVNAAERLHKLRSISPLTNNTHSDDTQHDPLPLDLSYISDNNKTNDSNNNSSNLRTDGNNNRKSKRDGSEWWQHVQFVVMDSPDHSVRDLPFLERHAKIKQVILQQQQRQQVVVVPDVHMCAGVEDLCTYYERVIANGGQGVILRNPSALYLPGLPFMWLKNKTFQFGHAEVLEVKTSALLCRNEFCVEFSIPLTPSAVALDSNAESAGTAIVEGKESASGPSLGSPHSFSLQPKSVITYGCHGVSPTTYVPSLPFFVTHHHGVTWDQISPYVVTPQTGRLASCATCTSPIPLNHLCVKVNSLYKFHSGGVRVLPLSFHLRTQCLAMISKHQRAQAHKHTYPPFSSILADTSI